MTVIQWTDYEFARHNKLLCPLYVNEGHQRVPAEPDCYCYGNTGWCHQQVWPDTQQQPDYYHL